MVLVVFRKKNEMLRGSGLRLNGRVEQNVPQSPPCTKKDELLLCSSFLIYKGVGYCTLTLWACEVPGTFTMNTPRCMGVEAWREGAVTLFMRAPPGS